LALVTITTAGLQKVSLPENFSIFLHCLITVTPKPFWMVFSVPANLDQLFKVVPNSQNSPNVIACLNGIRVLSIVWVMIGHSFVYIVVLANINTFDVIPVS